jgi:hypothetical protein
VVERAVLRMPPGPRLRILAGAARCRIAPSLAGGWGGFVCFELAGPGT